MDSVSPTNPYHISRAYQVEAPLRITPTSRASIARAIGTDPAAETQPTAKAQAPERTGLNRLVAGVVDGSVDFSGDQPQPGSTSLPLYTNPADRNAAAVGVSLGRMIDISG